MKFNPQHHKNDKGRPHWLQERVTAILLMPLTIWASFSVLRSVGQSREILVKRLGKWPQAALLILMAGLAARHVQLGLDVIIGDYLRGARRQSAKILARIFCLGFVVSVVVSLMQLRRQYVSGENK